MDNFNDRNEVMENNEPLTDKTLNFMKNTKKQNKGKKSKILSYVAVGLISSLIGGTVSIGAFLYVLPNFDLFKNTPLYQNLTKEKGGTYVNAAPMSTVKGALSVTEIAKKVGPAVVGVSVKTGGQSDVFGFSTGQQEGMGSGIIINEEGYILTNYHVINGADQVSIILNNNKEVAAKVINYDAQLDLAIVKVTDNIKMPAVAELGNSKDLQVGDSVVAIGNPLGKELLGSVTTGVISATNREISVGNSKQTLLQTDAAINPGNSGGALVNSFGQVIGVNSAKMGGNGVEGLGFAIPIDIVKPKLQGLLKPILKIGIAGRDITSDMSKKYKVPEGVYIAEVQEFSPAEKCGLKPGDIIKKFDGKNVKSINEVNDIKTSHKSGDEISLEVFRDGVIKNLKLKLSE